MTTCPTCGAVATEPKEVTELYRDLCKHPAMNSKISSRDAGDVAHHLYRLGYRKTKVQEYHRIADSNY